MRFIVLLIVFAGCGENTNHIGEAEHLAACAAACQKSGAAMASYNDTTGICSCSTPAAPSASR
jgi:hypothetical protein